MIESDLIPIQQALGNLRQYKLQNGLDVVIEYVPRNTLSAKLIVNHSTANERQDESGFAHFVEHMVMFGSFKDFSPEDCDRKRQRLGWYIPFTEPDKTYFPIGIMPSKVDVMLEYLSQAVFEQRFPQQRFGQERQRILRERAEDRRNPVYRDLNAYNAALFQNHPYSLGVFGIVGKKASIIKATPDDLNAFHSRGYLANNMTLILAGPVPFDAYELIKRNFDGRPSTNAAKSHVSPLNPLEEKVLLHMPAPDLVNDENPEDNTAHIFLGFIANPSSARERVALSLLWHILYNYTTSRVFQRISREEVLAYDLDREVNVFDLDGYLEIEVSVKSNARERAIDAIFDEFQRLRELPPRKEELDGAYENLAFKTAYMLERSKHHVTMIERYLQTGLTPIQNLEILRSLAPEEVQDAARKFLPPSRKDGKYVLMVRDPLLDSK